MDDRPNFYLLLDLDPNVDDAAAISKAIQHKKQLWSKQQSMGNPAVVAEAKANLARISEIQTVMTDPEARRREGDQARQQAKEQRRADLKRLDRMIAILRIDGAYAEKDVEKLIAELHGRISEGEVKKHLHDAGLSLDDQSASMKATTGGAGPRLDPARMDQLRPHVKFLGVKDLYEFLGMSKQASAKKLWESADQRNRELLRIGKTDAKTNTAKALCGQCMAIFDSEEKKTKYDRSLALEGMESMRTLIELAGARNSFLSIEQQDELVKQARELGVEVVDARAFIEGIAVTRKWGLQRSKKLPSEELRQCGNCLKLVKAAEATHCSGCGFALTVRCPRCNSVTPTEHAACTNCGFRIGDWSWIKLEVEKADKLIRELRVDDAARQLRSLLKGWPDWKILQSRLAEAERSIEERGQENAKLIDLVRQHKLFEAQVEAARYRRKWNAKELNPQISNISDGISRARKALEEGERRRLEGKFEDAIELCRSALTICADYTEARKAMALIRPAEPVKLTVVAQGRGFHLRWEAADRTVDGYAVARKPRSTPTHPADGNRQVISDVALTDPEVQEGIPWHYAVFSHRDGIYSANAARSGPHLRLAPVQQLVAVAGDGQVRLTWSMPNAAVGVEVWRRQGSAPDRRGLGTRLLSSRDSLHDLGLQNDMAVGYLVVPLFEDPQRSDATLNGPGSQCIAIPTAPPLPITDLRAERTQNGVRLAWTPPDAQAHIHVRQLEASPKYDVSTILSKDQVEGMGKAVLPLGRESAHIELSAVGEIWFVPLTIKANTAVVGKPVSITLVDGLQEVAIDQNGRDVYLRWAWPPSVSVVAVCYGYRRYALSPTDAEVIRHDVNIEQYKREGMFALRNVEKRLHYFSLFVLTSDKRLHSDPLTRSVQIGQPREVRYRIISSDNFFTRFRNAARRPELEMRGFGQLPETVLVAKPRAAPTGPDDGEKLLRLPEMQLNGTYRVPIPMSIASSGNVAKLFFTDPHYVEEIRLISGPIHELKL